MYDCPLKNILVEGYWHNIVRPIDVGEGGTVLNTQVYTHPPLNNDQLVKSTCFNPYFHQRYFIVEEHCCAHGKDELDHHIVAKWNHNFIAYL